MESLNLIFAALGGAVIGVIIGKFFFATSARAKEAEKELNQVKKEYADYKIEVNSHFSQTADLVNQMTDSYKAVHKHLSTGAQSLCSEDGKPALEGSARFIALGEPGDDENKSSKPVIQPRDYAEREDPKAKGTLSEDFGLERKPAIKTTEAGIPTIAEDVDLERELKQAEQPRKQETSPAPAAPPRDYAEEPVEEKQETDPKAASSQA